MILCALRILSNSDVHPQFEKNFAAFSFPSSIASDFGK